MLTEKLSDFSKLYNDTRPIPPRKVCEIVLVVLHREKVDTVVDLGSGTGLSTAIWRGYAKQVIGIEPDTGMRGLAVKNCKKITFLEASASHTSLEDNCADVVTCSQSFHWMDPVAALQEVDRILKPGGIFVVYDCKWPVTISYDSEIAYGKLFHKVNELTEKYRDVLPQVVRWNKNEHQRRIETSGYFSYCKDVYFENKETCGAERFIGMALSQSSLQTLLRHNIGEIVPEIEKFEARVKNDIRNKKTMYVSYRMIFGLKD